MSFTFFYRAVMSAEEASFFVVFEGEPADIAAPAILVSMSFLRCSILFSISVMESLFELMSSFMSSSFSFISFSNLTKTPAPGTIYQEARLSKNSSAAALCSSAGPTNAARWRASPASLPRPWGAPPPSRVLPDSAWPQHRLANKASTRRAGQGRSLQR